MMEEKGGMVVAVVNGRGGGHTQPIVCVLRISNSDYFSY